MRKLTVAIASILVMVVVPDAHAVTFVGTGGADIIMGTNTTDSLSGGDGGDHLFGKGNPATIKKRKRGRVRRIPSPDVLNGGSGANFLFGGSGPDRLIAGPTDPAHNVTLVDDDGTPGDVLIGGAGDDTLYSADLAKDSIDCGAGSDIAYVDPSDVVTGCEAVFAGEAGPFTGTFKLGTSGDETLSGAAIMAGAGGADTLNGGIDFNALLGGPGADQLNGNDELDLLIDDDGTPGDVLDGGFGDFDQLYSADGAVDTITCGVGIGDEAYLDPGDILTDGHGCEFVHRGEGGFAVTTP